MAQTVPNKITIGRGATVTAVVSLCTTANSKGKSVPVPAVGSACDVQHALKFLRPLCAAYSLPVPGNNLDWNAVTSLCNLLATTIG